MWVVAEDLDTIVNLDHVSEVEIEGKTIIAVLAHGGTVVLYRTTGSAERELGPKITSLGLALGAKTISEIDEEVSAVEVGDTSRGAARIRYLGGDDEDRGWTTHE